MTIGTPIAAEALPIRKQRRMQDRGRRVVDLFEARSKDNLEYFIDLRTWFDPTEPEYVTGAVAVSAPDDLVVINVHYAPLGIVVRLAGGNDRVRHEVDCTFTTSLGRSETWRFIVWTEGTEPYPGQIINRLVVSISDGVLSFVGSSNVTVSISDGVFSNVAAALPVITVTVTVI